MSIRVMTRVWDTAQAEGGALLVLLALSDYADDDGYAYPKEAQIASKARLSDRQVRRVIKALADRGELAYRTNQGRSARSWYVVLTGLDEVAKAEKIAGLAERENRTIYPDISSGKKRKPDICDTKTGHLRHLKPDICDTSRGDLGPPNGSNGDPNRHVIRHDPPPPPTAAAPGGGGGVADAPSEPAPKPPAAADERPVLAVEEQHETRQLLKAAGVRSPQVLRRLAERVPVRVFKRCQAEARKAQGVRDQTAILVGYLDAWLETGELPGPPPAQATPYTPPPPLPPLARLTPDEVAAMRERFEAARARSLVAQQQQRQQ